jgi:hypothetical protein
MKSATIAIVLALGAAACSQAIGSAPASDVCALVREETDKAELYQPVEDDVPNLETCAARLEAIRMIRGRPVTGIYNGHFIFVTEADILSAQTLEGSRFRVFEPKDRKTIQDGIRVLIDQDAAQVDRGR